MQDGVTALCSLVGPETRGTAGTSTWNEGVASHVATDDFCQLSTSDRRGNLLYSCQRYASFESEGRRGL